MWHWVVAGATSDSDWLAGGVEKLLDRKLAATAIARSVRDERRSVREIVLERGLLGADEFDQLVSHETVMRLGAPPRPESDPPSGPPSDDPPTGGKGQ